MFHIALIFAMGLFTNQTSICAGFFYVFVEQSNSQMISDALINFFDNPGEIFELHPLNHCNCRYRCVEVSRTDNFYQVVFTCFSNSTKYFKLNVMLAVS